MHDIVLITRNDTKQRSSCLPARMTQLVKKCFFVIPIGIICNVFFSFAGKESDVFRILSHFSPVYFILAILLSVVPWFTSSARLYFWSRFIGNSLRYRNVFKVVLGVELGAAVIPPLIGGGGTKIAMLMYQGMSGGMALSLTLLESLEDGIFFILAVPIALTLALSWDLPVIMHSLESLRQLSLWVLLVILCAALLLVMMIRYRIVFDKLQRFPYVKAAMERIKPFCQSIIATYSSIIQSGKGIFVLTMALTAVSWICRYSLISLLLMSLGITVQPVPIISLQVIVFALMTVIPTPGAAGGAEIIFSLLYRSFLPDGVIGVVTAGWRFLTFYLLLLLASFLLLLLAKKQKGSR